MSDLSGLFAAWSRLWPWAGVVMLWRCLQIKRLTRAFATIFFLWASSPALLLAVAVGAVVSGRRGRRRGCGSCGPCDLGASWAGRWPCGQIWAGAVGPVSFFCPVARSVAFWARFGAWWYLYPPRHKKRACGRSGGSGRELIDIGLYAGRCGGRGGPPRSQLGGA